MWLIASQIKVSFLKSCVLESGKKFPQFPQDFPNPPFFTMPNKMNDKKTDLSHQVPYFLRLFFSFLQFFTNIKKIVFQQAIIFQIHRG